jgi:hypothetical protein
MAGENDSKPNDDSSLVNQALEGLTLSDDPFAPQPERKPALQNQISEDEITVREVSKQQPAAVIDEDTVIQKMAFSVSPTRSELPRELSTKNYLPQKSIYQSALGKPLKRLLRIFLLLIFGAALVLGGFFIWKMSRTYFVSGQSPQVGREKASKRIEAQAPRVSALSFIQNGKITGPRALVPGTVTVSHYIESWQARAGQPVRLVAALRLFDANGKLVLSRSQLASYAGKVDGRSRKIKFSADLTIAPQVKNGDYRLIVELTDLNAKRSALLQSRLTLTAPKSN